MTVVFVLASCTTVYKSSSTMDVSSTLTSTNSAELEVSPVKVSLIDYAPTKKEKRGGYENVKKIAVAKLLKENGNADILIEPQYEITSKRKKIKRISVSGYPATYKNFKTSVK